MSNHSRDTVPSDDDAVRIIELAAFTRALLECVTSREVVTVILERGISLLGAAAGLATLVTRDGQELEVVRVADGIGDNTAWFSSHRFERAKYAVPAEYLAQTSEASVSLPVVSQQQVFGALHFAFSEARPFTEADRGLLEQMTQQGAVALEKAFLLEEALQARRIAEIARCKGDEERKRLVTELEAANARQLDFLHQSEERFRLLVEGVRDYAIFLLDPQGNISTWNAGAERFKGYRASEIIGQHFSRFYTQADIDRRHPWAELEIAKREGRYEEEGLRVRKDGSQFWANVVITALRNDHGDLYGFAKVTRDVTERHVREAERAAAQAKEQQRQFLKDVLVSVTQGRLILCDEPYELPRPLAYKPVGEPIPLSRRALKAVRERVEVAAEACELPLALALDLITASSECAMNAVQHAGGGIAHVYAKPESGIVQVWVQDSGKGIELSHLPRATLEPGFSTGGVGIGHGFSLMLSCCQRIYLLTGASGTTVVLEQERQVPEPAWLQAFVGK